jgi:hypothetical protein
VRQCHGVSGRVRAVRELELLNGLGRSGLGREAGTVPRHARHCHGDGLVGAAGAEELRNRRHGLEGVARTGRELP